jgi:type II secretory pathway pseudopilin PulG
MNDLGHRTGCQWIRSVKKIGLTLLELLLVLGLALALAAVLMPMLSNLMLQGKRSDDLQRMRQLGVAAAVYANEAGATVRSCAELVEARRVEKQLCSSVADPTGEGYANVFRKQAYDRLREPRRAPKEYRLSFVGIADVVGMHWLLPQGSPGTTGWLIDVAGSDQGRFHSAEPRLALRQGPYRRLLDDSAVVVRRFPVVTTRIMSREEHRCFAPHWLYADFAQEQLQKECSDAVRN